MNWRLLDSTGSPIANLSSATISTTTAGCAGDATIDVVEETLAGGSGLLNLGNGFYQVNWKTPKTYANSCRTMRLDLHDGVTHDARFQFTK